MEFIDTHSHLYLKDFDKDRDEVIQSGVSVGVTRILLPNIDAQSITPLLDLCKNYPQICYPMIGLHPCSVKKDFKEVLQKIFVYFPEYQFIGVGEVGIDLYWDKTYLDEQKEALRIQIRFALEHNLPVIIHKRQSYYETMEVLDEFKGEKLKGIFHCYSGSLEHAKEIIDKGFLLGIGGTVTYKTSNLDTILPDISLKHIVLETDAPFLSPVPHRGQRNQSPYINLVAKKIAEIKQVSIEEVAEQTTKNAVELFSL